MNTETHNEVMKIKVSYSAYLQQKYKEGKQSYTITFSQFPEIIEVATHFYEALAKAKVCLEKAIAHRIVEGKEIPPVDMYNYGHTVIAEIDIKVTSSGVFVIVEGEYNG